VIETAFFDIDGVLTDGSVYVDSSGNELKRLYFVDIDALFELKRAQIQLGFITGEEGGFCDYVRARFAPKFFLTGCKDKRAAFEQLLGSHSIGLDTTCYVGDSRKDIELLRYVPLSFAPADADEPVKQAARIVLRARRGEGVIREVADYCLSKVTTNLI
jgi:YrbI family 3-deoxy-D-manno-octulosonate 8-phosphate phosphatase